MSPDLFMLVASVHTPDPKFRYMIDHPHQMNLFVNRLRFTVQSEEAWFLTKEDISSSFSSLCFEVLDVNFINPYMTAGFLFFDDKEDTKTDNSVVEVKGCLIHAHVDIDNMPPFPSDHQEDEEVL